MIRSVTALLSAGFIAGCSTVVPQFDIPVDRHGLPTVKTIVERVRCELGEIATGYGPHNFLVEQKANVAVQLNLEVNDTGGLSPSFEYLNGAFTFTATPTLSQSRDQSYNQLLLFTMEEIAEEFKDPKKLQECTIGYTNLEGRLGIKESISLSSTAPNTNYAAPLAGTNGVFGGFVQFIVTKSVSAGPNWTLKHFVGPGKIATVSEVNTDKIIFAVAFPAKKEKDTAPAQERATAFINQININHLTVQLGNINNSLQLGNMNNSSQLTR